LNVLVYRRLQAAFHKLKSQTGLIRGLQEARPQGAVYLDGGTDNALVIRFNLSFSVISAPSAFSAVNKYL